MLRQKSAHCVLVPARVGPLPAVAVGINGSEPATGDGRERGAPAALDIPVAQDARHGRGV